MTKHSLIAILISIVIYVSSISISAADDDVILFDEALTNLVPEFLVEEKIIKKWHKRKYKIGATYSGSRPWKKYVKFLEQQLKKFGAVDIQKNIFVYDRWYTGKKAKEEGAWSFTSDAHSVRVAHYGAYSGSTGESGITANLVLYRPGMPLEQLSGKIVVFATAPHPQPPYTEEYIRLFTYNDYEYLSEDADVGDLLTYVPTDKSVAFDTWWQLRQTFAVTQILAQSQAAGGIIIYDMGYERLKGLYTFPVLPLINSPTLYIDKVAGKKVFQDALEGKSATITLQAKVEETETHQLIAYLPGAHYGTANDERILLTTHTDGPNLQQENGALGLLSIVGYYSNIPQAHRPRTLLIYFDNRHYMPGLEAAFAQHDWFTLHPEERDSVVALVCTEHLGQVEFIERGENNEYKPSGKPEVSLLWTRANQVLIDKAIAAVKASEWPRVFVQSVERPGIHGGPQGIWYGLGAIALDWDIPAYATMGIQGGYWTNNVTRDAFDVDLFMKQINSMTRLTGELMTLDLDGL